MFSRFARVLSLPISRPTVQPFAQSLRFFSAKPPLDVQQIEDRVLELLRNFEKVKQDKLALDAHFVKDLGLDSLDQVEITMELEDEFNVEIPDSVAETIFTPRQAVEAVNILSVCCILIIRVFVSHLSVVFLSQIYSNKGAM